MSGGTLRNHGWTPMATVSIGARVTYLSGPTPHLVFGGASRSGDLVTTPCHLIFRRWLLAQILQMVIPNVIFRFH